LGHFSTLSREFSDEVIMPKNDPHAIQAFSAKSFFRRGLLLGLAAIGMTLIPMSTALAQGTKPPAPEIKTETLTTADGWSIPITYYQSTAGKEAAVVVLLHGEGDNQLVWTQKTKLAERLHAGNYAVITCDLRKHGEAKHGKITDKKLEARDYQAMGSASKFSELEVIQDFLLQEHQAGRLNMAKLGILAVDKMAPVALNWAANDWTKKPYEDAPTLAAMTPRGQTVRAIALLSPVESVPGLSSAKPLMFFRKLNGTPVSFLFIKGAQDGSSRDMKDMQKQVTSTENKSVIFSESFPTKLKGADLFGRIPKADPLVVGFFNKQLQDLKVEWADRRSRLER
jgi:pimeloyl-ACP methyl ester carboxylesterase